MSLAMGLGAAVESGFRSYDYVKKKQKDKRDEARLDERHGLFVDSTKQEMGLRDKREERAGAQEKRAAKKAGLDFDIAQTKHKEFVDTSDYRAQEREQKLRMGEADIRSKRASANASTQRAGYYEIQRRNAAIDFELKNEIAPLVKEEQILIQQGKIDEAKDVRDQRNELSGRNLMDLYLNVEELAGIDSRAAAANLRRLKRGFDNADDIIFEGGKMIVIDKDRQIVNGRDARGNEIPGEISLSETAALRQQRHEEQVRAITPDKDGRLYSIKERRLVEKTTEELRDEHESYKVRVGPDNARDFEDWVVRNYRSGKEQAKVAFQQDKTRMAGRKIRAKAVKFSTKGNKPKKLPAGVDRASWDSMAIDPTDPSYDAWIRGDYANVKPDAATLPRYMGVVGGRQVELF